MSSDYKLVLLPGLWDSGPKHWQSHWDKLPNAFRVRQADWETPLRDDWVRELDLAVDSCGPRTVVAAHSLGCATVAHWASIRPRAILGSLLVAPSDVEAPSYPKGTTGFTPMPLNRLPFRSIVVRSTDDPYVSMERAEQFARSWGSEVVTVENGGHLNSDSDLGDWPLGMRLVESLASGK